MKKLKKLLMIVLILVFTSLSSGCFAKFPIPTIKEGRFEFAVTYEVDGEEKTYAGVYVCKFDGAYKTFVGSGLDWSGYVENEPEIDLPIQTNDDGTVYINFGFFPEYFMGDPEAEYYPVPEPSLYMIYHDDDPEVFHITGEDEVIAGYGVRLISYNYADPIENKFVDKLTSYRFEPSIN